MSTPKCNRTFAVWMILILSGFGGAVLADKSANKNDKAASTKNFLVFGFLPMESPVSLFKRFAPLRDYLTTQIDTEIRLETAQEDSQDVEKAHKTHEAIQALPDP